MMSLADFHPPDAYLTAAFPSSSSAVIGIVDWFLKIQINDYCILCGVCGKKSITNEVWGVAAGELGMGRK